jgi:hypothetical protein
MLSHESRQMLKTFFPLFREHIPNESERIKTGLSF